MSEFSLIDTQADGGHGQPADRRPLISVIMANYRGAAYLETAVNSVLGQTETNIELIISDDASPDDSVAIVKTMMAHDKRVRLLTAETNSGPARARNRALVVARGEWIAIVDSDDLLHPHRFERLLAAAAYYQADIVADDLLHFNDTDRPEISYLLTGEKFATPFRITPSHFLGGRDSGMPAFGYLKPMFRATILKNKQYNETLKIGEDYDLVLRLLLEGAAYVVVPEPFYLYRRHPNSISYRLSEATVRAMAGSLAKLRADYGPFEADVTAAFDEQFLALAKALDFERFTAAIKGLKPLAALTLAVRHPGFLVPIAAVFSDRLSRYATKIRSRLSTSQTTAKRPPATILFADETLTEDRLKQARSFAERHASVLLVEKVFALADPVEAWKGSQETGKEQWRRVADIGVGNIAALIYDSPAGEFASGFIPVPGKKFRLSVPTAIGT